VNDRDSSTAPAEEKLQPKASEPDVPLLLGLDGRSPALAAWDALVVAATIFVVGHAPLVAVRGAAPQWTRGLDLLATLIFFADIGLRFRRPLRIAGRPVRDPALIRSRYLRTWLAPDLVGAIPFDLMAFAVGGPAAALLRLLGLSRLLRLARLVDLQREWRTRTTIRPAIFRLSFFLLWASIGTHWIACGWLALHGPTRSHPELPEYLRALYWTITTLTTVGYGDITPATAGQVLYATVVMVLGAGMYGYIIGNVANLLANADVLKSQHLGRLEMISGFLRDRDVPKALQGRVRDYYTYLWESRMSNPARLLDDLPPALQVEIGLHLSRSLLLKVPLFQNASEPFLRELVQRLEPAVVTPGDYVFRRGEVGDRIYFIHRGAVEVLVDDAGEAVATLHEGDFFGEMALLHREPRSASVRALDYCDLYWLDSADFERVLEKFPDFAAQIRRAAQRRRGEVDVEATTVERPVEDA